MSIRVKSALAFWILTILFISLSPVQRVDAQNTFIALESDNEIEVTDGLAWAGINCPNTNIDCEPTNVTITWPDGSSDVISPSSTEILKNVSSGKISIIMDTSFNDKGWILKTVLPSPYGHEIIDHPEHSGHQSVKNAITDGKNTGNLNGTDSDVIHIIGNQGDILEIQPISSRYPLSLDIIDTSGQVPVLLGTLENSRSLVEIPSNEGVYLKIHSNDGEDVNPYSFEIDVWTDEDENPYLISPNTIVTGTIGSMDTEGDFYLLKVGPGAPVEMELETSDQIELRYVENGEMIQLNQSSGTVLIEDVGETNSTLQIHIRSTNTVSYRIVHTVNSQSDGSTLGDAPDLISNLQRNRNAYPIIQDDEGWYTGYLTNEDDIDYWLFEISNENGSIVNLIPSSESKDCCIMEIVQLTNSTNSASTFNVIGKGTHAIRISLDPNRTSESNPTTYLIRLQLQDIEESVYIDRSGEFLSFYIFIGFLMLSPLLPIAYWQWQDRNIIRVEKHERLRLIRLRERLSGIGLDSTEDEDIDAALSSLGDAEWDALIHEWGRPDVKHSTEDLEIAAWRLDMNPPTLLIGLRPSVTWNHAGVRLAATMGDRVEINEVHPSHLHFEDEIVLDKMEANKLHFLRVQHSQGSTKLDVFVTGTVEGIPMAAMPSKALRDSEE